MPAERPDTIEGNARCDEPGPDGLLRDMTSSDAASTDTAGPSSLWAPWWRRVCAWLVDATLLVLAVGACGRASAAAGGFAILLLPVTYATVCHGSRHGQTVGARVARISVRDRTSLGRLGYPRALARWLVTTVFWWTLLLPGVLDALSPLWDRRRQAWHDKAVGAVVIRL
jgi:uncharacterized RDD family membrane protein YckC